MDLSELQHRIDAWEDLRTEFKAWPIPNERLAATLVAFANSEGGDLIVGVEDDGTLQGVEDADAVSRAIDNIAFNNCVPPITVEQTAIRLESGRRILVVNVERGEMQPYCTQKGNTIYVRTSSGRRPASREEILRLYQASGSFFYDEKPLPRLTIDDLDLAAFDHYLADTLQDELRDDPERLLVNWRLLSRGGAPTVAGLLLFGRHPQRHLPFAQVNAARFAGIDSSYDPSDRKDLAGRLVDVIDQAERFVDLHLPVPHEIRDFEPEPRPELPKVAIREAIVNALAHRDYTIPGPVRLFIFDDRIEIHTPGRPPNTIDEGAMRAGVHVVRNPAIYARLADLGLSTRAGTGVRRMIRLVREATGREVGIEVTPAEVIFTLPRPRASGGSQP
ncbi:MAG: RNA-binding domain-containing protein [Acidobacteriota bacterium]